jgi:hypothetical protein
MDLEDVDCWARFMFRDRDGKVPVLFDTVLTNAGIEVVLSGERIPRTNSITERWVQTCHHELLDRTLIWNRHHLLRALREFEQFCNGHRPHQCITNARPLHPLPPTDHRSGADRPPRHTETRPTRRHPPPVPTCRVTCRDEVFDKDTVARTGRTGRLDRAAHRRS